MNRLYKCCGIVVFRYKKELEFLIVKSKKGNLSFPKGKIEKGETDYECAIRETFEETGIKEDGLNFIKNGDEYVTFKEISKKGNCSVLYYLAECKGDPQLLYVDPEELSWVGWLSYTDLISFDDDRIKSDRKRIAKNIALTLTNR